MTLPSSGPLSLTDIQTEFGGTNPIGMNEYYAGGGLVPAGTSGTYGAVPSSGALSVQNFYGTSNFVPVYIEDIFSTYLYTGNGSTQAINNGINVSGSGGMVWIKDRSRGNTGHAIASTASAATNWLGSNITNVYQTSPRFSSLNSNGFTVDSGGNSYFPANYLNDTYVSWTFRKQPKFFDIVTYTGNGAVRTISHNLGSVPGCIMVKRVSGGASDWYVQHRSLGPTYDIFLNSTSAALGSSNAWNSTAPTSTVFSLGLDSNVNSSGDSFIAYLFAHDAGGFGLTGSDNVVSCGSFSFSSGIATVNLGYEPQYLMLKKTDGAEQWWVFDIMRGMTASTVGNNYLGPNTSLAENDLGSITQPTATGFYLNWANQGITTGNYIYIAIRRGPMKVPTTGASVFAPVTWTGNGTGARVITGAPQAPDMVLENTRNNSNNYWNWFDRLRAFSNTLYPYATSSEGVNQGLNYGCKVMNMNGHTLGDLDGGTGGYNASGTLAFAYYLTRAPSFFDEVCYTGTGSARTISHNLRVAPELMITKQRSGTSQWNIYQANLGASAFLQFTTATVTTGDSTRWNSTAPTSSVFSLGTSASLNSSGQTYVWYGFATCTGVSKVGSYTGTGATQTISCGFTGGARFVLVKRTDSTGDWYVWDTARGMVAGTDPSLLLNSTAAEVNANSIYTTTGGFQIVSTAAGINASGGTYIYLAIA